MSELSSPPITLAVLALIHSENKVRVKKGFLFFIEQIVIFTLIYFLFSRESKRWIITRAPTPPPALVMIHLFDSLGCKVRVKKGFLFFY
jgi:hypothetical protein